MTRCDFHVRVYGDAGRLESRACGELRVAARIYHLLQLKRHFLSLPRTWTFYAVFGVDLGHD